MKIALIGSAGSSIGLAPFGDPSWKIWGCSPGAYYRCPRVDAWFEFHRWEPPVVGKPEQQQPWFTPEYVAWLFNQETVFGFDLPETMPGACMYPSVRMRAKYGDYNFTSSLAWMFALAIENILGLRADRDPNAPTEVDEIGLWGVDMSASEEYGYQRAGCQFFVQIATHLGITVRTPPESDLMTPPVLYGLWETTHKAIKFTARRRELEARIAALEQQRTAIDQQFWFLKGALDDMEYMVNNWSAVDDPPMAPGANFADIFGHHLVHDNAIKTLETDGSADGTDGITFEVSINGERQDGTAG